MAIIHINGKAMPNVIALSYKFTDLMTDNSGRLANGTARVKYVRTDIFGADLEFPHMTEDELGKVLAEIGTNNEKRKIFTVTFNVGGIEVVTNRKCYPGDRTITLESNAEGDPRYSLSFSVAEI